MHHFLASHDTMFWTFSLFILLRFVMGLLGIDSLVGHKINYMQAYILVR